MLTSLSGVICSGNICFDILVRPVDRIEWNRTIWVDSIEQQLGGNGSNTSYTLALLGVPVKLLGMVGQDAFGDQLLAVLAGAGVELAGVGRSQAPTTATTCLVDSKGDRVFLHRPGSSAEAFPEAIDFPPVLSDGMSHYHLANVFALPRLREHAAESLQRAHSAGLTTSFDTGWDATGRWLEDVASCLPHVDLLFMNHDEARILTGANDPNQAARKMQQLGARDVVVKMAGDGCGIFTPGCAVHVPAFEVPVVDSTGAGDCFVGGFLAALHRCASYEQAARLANAVGALSVQKLGAITGLRSYPETTAWMESARVRTA
jgi:sugar/nucleoside kinase (ribokinase family)